MCFADSTLSITRVRALDELFVFKLHPRKYGCSAYFGCDIMSTGKVLTVEIGIITAHKDKDGARYGQNILSYEIPICDKKDKQRYLKLWRIRKAIDSQFEQLAIEKEDNNYDNEVR